MQASLVAQKVKSLPAVQDTWVRSLSQEDPLEKEMAAHSSILASEIPWTEEPSGLLSMGLQRVGHEWATNTFTLICEKIGNVTVGFRTEKRYMNMMFQKDVLD